MSLLNFVSPTYQKRFPSAEERVQWCTVSTGTESCQPGGLGGLSGSWRHDWFQGCIVVEGAMWWRQNVSSSCVFLHTAHITHQRCDTAIHSDIQWYTVIYSDTTQVDKDLLQMPTAQEILRCFPVATCFSLSQTFTIMAYSSGATLPCQNFMNSTWQFVILWLLHVYYVLWGIRACIFIPMFLPNSAYLRSVMCLFWRSLQTFRLRHDTIFACVRSVGWRTRPLAALQLWVFGCFQNVLNVCS